MKTRPFKPHELARMTVTRSKRPRIVEVISMPTPEGTIMVRMVPGDPSTLREVLMSTLTMIPKERYCYIARVLCNGYKFPEDMLRYDRAAFYDADKDEAKDKSVTSYTHEEVLIYTIGTRRQPSWTAARWRSFGVSILHVRVYDMQAEYLKTIAESFGQ